MPTLDIYSTFCGRTDVTHLTYDPTIHVDTIASHVRNRLLLLGAVASAYSVFQTIGQLQSEGIIGFRFDNKKQGDEHVTVEIQQKAS